MEGPRRVSRRAFLAAAVSGAAVSRGAAQDSSPALAFCNVSVVPMDVERVLERHTVLVRDGRIASLGPVDETPVPEGAEIVDATGLYLMPGLCDLHIHVFTSIASPDWANDLFLYLANGITTVRDMWAVSRTLERRDAIRAGEAIAPDMWCSSPGMDGPGGSRTALQAPVATADEGRRLVDLYRRRGYDYIKVYSSLAPDVFFAICREAAAQEIRVVGHVPWAVPLPDAIDAGMYSGEHFLGSGVIASPTRYLSAPEIDLARLEETAAMVASSRMWKCGVLAIRTQVAARIEEYESRPEMRYVSPEMRGWFRDPRFRVPPARPFELANAQAVLRAMFAAGAKTVAGTDSGISYVLPGYSFHDELRWTVEAGLSPYETLRLATVNAAIHLGQGREMGTVEPGKIADLILVRGNPLEDVANVARPVGVMTRGRLLPEAAILRTLETIACSYEACEPA